MDNDWELVKKLTLWNYEQLVMKLLKTLAYGFVLEHYNHTMDEAGRYAKKVREGYLQGRNEPSIVDPMLTNFKKLEDLQVKSYLDLVQQVESREKCESFLERTGFGFDELIETLNYLFRWVLPFMTPVREFIDLNNETDRSYFEILKEKKLGLNLDILEQGRTRDGRADSPRLAAYQSASSLNWCIKRIFPGWLMCAARRFCICAAADIIRWIRLPVQMWGKWNRRWRRITRGWERAWLISRRLSRWAG